MLWAAVTVSLQNGNLLTGKSVLQSETYAPYFVINPINEWSNVGSVSRSMYCDVYKNIIKRIRGAGYTNAISMNGYHGGQYSDSFTYDNPDTNQMNGLELLNSEPLKNYSLG